MNQKSHNNLLKSLLLISKIRFSDVDEIIKFGKTEIDRKRKIKRIKNSYEKKDEDNTHIKPGFLDKIFPSENDDFDANIDPEMFDSFFMSDEEYKKLADIIGEAMDEMDNEKFKEDNADLNKSNLDSKIFKKDPSFEDLVEWFRLLLLSNNGELQLTITPGNELIMIFKDFVSPSGSKNESNKPKPKQRKKRTPRNKKGPSTQQDDE